MFVHFCRWNLFKHVCDFLGQGKFLIPIHNILQLQNRALQSYMILQNTLVRATTTHCKETIIVVSKRNYLKREIIEWQSTWEACVICEWTCIDQVLLLQGFILYILLVQSVSFNDVISVASYHKNPFLLILLIL